MKTLVEDSVSDSETGIHRVGLGGASSSELGGVLSGLYLPGIIRLTQLGRSSLVSSVEGSATDVKRVAGARGGGGGLKARAKATRKLGFER